MKIAALLLALLTLPPQTGPVPAVDPARLETWRDWKFGFMVHWGPYSQWGAVESWTLCSEDESWCRRPIEDYAEYRRRYEALPMSFDPVHFDPASWAAAARGAGMRYFVFTTKHHDGFCMWDTQTTTYRITGPDCAFAGDERADVTRSLFDAFRSEGLGVGVYFSKPDWHSDDYWWRNFATPDRNVNYSIERYPARWERFKAFTRAQLEELMGGYGPIDILWLDGGWVRPKGTITPDVEVWCKSPEDQDIDMPSIVRMARGHQPGLIVVDRTVRGPFEDYSTPEQHVPDEPLDGPWETCMTMANQWSYKPGDVYKSTNTLVHRLVEVVAKGGNFLLNVGPDSEGRLPVEALERMAAIGAWMDVHGSAIHGTRPVAPYRSGNVAFTRGADGGTHAIVLLEEGQGLPAQVSWSGPGPRPGARLELLGYAADVPFERRGDTTHVDVPGAARGGASPARVFRFTAE